MQNYSTVADKIKLLNDINEDDLSNEKKILITQYKKNFHQYTKERDILFEKYNKLLDNFNKEHRNINIDKINDKIKILKEKKKFLEEMNDSDNKFKLCNNNNIHILNNMYDNLNDKYNFLNYQYYNIDIDYEKKIKNIKIEYESKNDKVYKLIDEYADKIEETINEFYENFNKNKNAYIPEVIKNDTQSIDNIIESKTFLKVGKNKNVVSPKVQQYDPITLQYIKTYDSISDTLRFFREELNFPNFSDNTLKAAVHGNYEYAGYRWYIIDRNIEDKPYQLQPTEKIHRAKRNQLIARLNIDKNQILEVYPSQKDAANSVKLSSIVSISDAIKNESISRGCYWKFYDDCDEDLKNEFLQKGGLLPETKPVISGAKSIQQIHPYTNEVLETFSTIKEVQLKFKMSRDSLKKAIEKKNPHNGFYWAYA
jgi:hypothetical protein